MRKAALVIFILINLLLNIYGNDWGLPSRWHSDEKVANVLHMANEKTLIDPIGEYLHPTGYHLFLLTSFIPVYGYLKLINYPIASLKEAASISWIHMAKLHPGFATGIYIYARALSALLGALTVYLIYLLGKEMYDEKVGLFAAASLSVCMGFVGVNHFAKYTSLVNLLIVLVILFCIKALKERTSRSSNGYLFFGFLSAGYASSVHINAPLLLLPLFLTFIFIGSNLFNKFKSTITMLISCISLYVTGLIVGTPSLLTNFKNYFLRLGHKYDISLINKPATDTIPLFVGPINYFIEILSIYGIPLSILIVLGTMRSLFSWRKITKKEVIVFSFIISYYFVITMLHEDKFPQTKLIIAVVPLLTIFAGKLIYDMFLNKWLPKIGAYLLLSFVFLYSFAYSLKADSYFKEADTRYESTQWITKNISRDSRIEVFDQLNFVASTDIMNDYEIIYLGSSSSIFQGEHFFKWNKIENREEYLKHINRYDSPSDYIIIDLDDINRLYQVNFMSHLPGLAEYMRSLFEGKKNFRIAKIFTPKNPRIKSKAIKGLIYPKDLLWNPIPSYKDTAVTIYIFKRLDDAKIKFK